MTEKIKKNVVPKGTVKSEQLLKKRKTVSLESHNNKRAMELALGQNPYFFSPRWISKYLVQSIKKTRDIALAYAGDISLAFDLLLKDKEKYR
jgi:hypothetical protein